MDNEYAIELENVHKAFKVKKIIPKNRNEFNIFSKDKRSNNVVLDKISLKIKKGESIGIIGRNGSGKSTLLKIISRILEPDSGTLEINGKIASILELGMGFHHDLSGRENAYIKGSMYGFSKKQMDEKIEKIIEYSGLESQIDDPLRTYSSGMSGRLAFAIMINVDAEILIIDEILSVGDASFSAKASQHFKQAAKSGKTILFVSHSIGSIIEMCDRTIWIENGRIKEDGKTKIVCDHYKREINESFEITKEFAEVGVVDAQYRLAHMYIDGDKVERDIQEAFKWMGIAAESNVDAMIEYGDMLFEGIGAERDIQAAIGYYQKAASLGSNDAAIKIAAFTDNSDRDSLLNIFKQLAEKGFPNNEFLYADLMLKTSLSKEDKQAAFKWFERAAEKGHLDAKYRLATLYRRGIGTVKSIERHVTLLEEIADLGHIWAQHDLAELFFSGKIVEKDDARAFKWYLKSAENGISKSQYQVAAMYKEGIGIEVNLEESGRWFKIFSNSSLIKFWSIAGNALNVTQLDTNLTPEDIHVKMAESFDQKSMIKLGKAETNFSIEWLQHAAEKQNMNALLLLGDLCLNGKGIEPDLARAFECYSKACIAGSSYAARQIAMMYKNGIFVEKDLKKYEEYMNYAMEIRGVKLKT
jgi:ABC-type polysaccharide/polyol phosphate transport system, ATPase component